jgi:hypothetical protein
MGLLDKAAFKTESEPLPDLDNMGKILRDRILRIPPGENSGGAALSLLKAWGSFQLGLCFALSGNVYGSYASSGSGEKTVRIPKNRLDPEKNGNEPFKLSSPAGITGLPPSCTIWIFPLDKGNPFKVFFLAAVENDSFFNTELMKLMLYEISSVILPPALSPKRVSKDGLLKRGQKKRNVLFTKPLNAADEIKTYSSSHAVFNCVVLELPESGEKDDFVKTVGNITASFGAAIPLPSPHCLVLFPETVDRFLVAHRLSNNLSVKSPLHFQAGSPEKALEFLRPYL